MITKKLLHDIVTFCNNYIDNKNITFGIDKYLTFIAVSINAWSINNKGLIDNLIGTINLHIHDIDDFNQFKQKVLNQLPSILKQIKEK